MQRVKIDILSSFKVTFQRNTVLLLKFFSVCLESCEVGKRGQVHEIEAY